MTEAPHLLVEEDDNILIATFNRPEKYNAMSLQLTSLLEEAILRFRDSAHLKVMLIRSTGKYFSSGADLKESARNAEGKAPPTTATELREMHRRLPSRMRQIWDEMEGIEKPFVVAHQGVTIGGSLEMSLSCDFRLAARSASYSFPEAAFGVLPATNGVSRLTRLVGPHWARLLIMANMPVDAEEARIMGLVHKIYADETFQEDALAFCRHVAKQDGECMGTAKIAIELCHDLPATQAASVERMANASLMQNPQYQANMAKHVESIGKKKTG